MLHQFCQVMWCDVTFRLQAQEIGIPPNIRMVHWTTVHISSFAGSELSYPKVLPAAAIELATMYRSERILFLSHQVPQGSGELSIHRVVLRLSVQSRTRRSGGPTHPSPRVCAPAHVHSDMERCNQRGWRNVSVLYPGYPDDSHSHYPCNKLVGPQSCWSCNLSLRSSCRDCPLQQNGTPHFSYSSYSYKNHYDNFAVQYVSLFKNSMVLRPYYNSRELAFSLMYGIWLHWFWQWKRSELSAGLGILQRTIGRNIYTHTWYKGEFGKPWAEQHFQSFSFGLPVPPLGLETTLK